MDATHGELNNFLRPDQLLGLPGELQPLEPRPFGDPIKPDEALGVARRHHMKTQSQRNAARKRARGPQTPPVPVADPPTELPHPEARPVQAAFRLPPRLLMLARGQAELEGGRTLTEVITEALEAYTRGAPGSRFVYRSDHRRSGQP